jgi:hypothetical protein
MLIEVASMRGIWKISWLVAILHCSCNPAANNPPGNAGYVRPLVLDQMFDTAKVKHDDALALAILGALLEVPRLNEANALTKAKAIALVLTLDPGNEEARGCDEQLASGKPMRASLKAPADVVRQLLEVRKKLLLQPSQASVPENRQLADSLADIAAGISIADSSLSLRVEQERLASRDLDWSKAFPALVAGQREKSPSLPKRPAPEGRLLAQTDAPKLKGKQSSVCGLLVRDLGANRYAGAASKITATVTQDAAYPEYEALIKFNQQVGNSMGAALEEVTQFTKLRHQGLPAGQIVTIGFQEKYSSKDGPSAAVACALLLEALYTGKPLNAQFAVTGDLTANGEVQAIGGITGKIRAALMGDCTILAVPAANASTLTDVVLLEGPASVSNVQIFLISSFDDALKLAAPEEERDSSLQQAITLFASVQDLLKRDPSKVQTHLRHPKVQERLTEVVKLHSDHASARLLLAAGQNRLPQTLTLRGSFAAMDEAAGPAYQAIETRSFQQRGFFDRNEFSETKIDLARVRTKLDPRARPLCDALYEFYELMAELVESTGSKGAAAIGAKLEVAAQRVTSARETLSRNPEIMEEIEVMQ